MAHFVPNFVAMATGVNQGENINDTIKLADPKNHTIEPMITTLSYTKPELWWFKALSNFPTGTIVIFHIFVKK